MASKRADTVVGAILIFIIAGAAAALAARSVHEQVLGGKRHFFLRAVNGRNVKEQAPVRMNGLDVGMVNEIRPDGDLIEVHFRVDAQFGSRVRTNATAALIQSPFGLGLTFIQITPGVQGFPEMPQGEIENRDPEALSVVLERLTKKADPLLARVKALTDAAAPLMETVQRVQGDLADGDGFVSRLIRDPELIGDLAHLGPLAATIVADLKDVQAVLSRREGALGKIAAGNVLKAEVQAVVDAARATMTSIDAVVERLSHATERVARRLDQFAASISGIDVVVANLDRAGRAVAGIAKRIADGRGTAGRILSDKDLVVELRRFLKDLSETGRDSSEMSPVNTVSGLAIKQVPRSTPAPTQGLGNTATK